MCEPDQALGSVVSAIKVRCAIFKLVQKKAKILSSSQILLLKICKFDFKAKVYEIFFETAIVAFCMKRVF